MSFSSLPNELAQEVLSHLPVRSLHSFALTSHASYTLARTSLRTLALGVFHNRINGLISFMDVPSTRPTSSSQGQSVTITLPKNDTKTRQQIIRNQNGVAAKIIRDNGASIRDLELVLWELEKPLADALATLPNLRRLSLRFDHPHARHAHVDRSYWDAAPTGTVWNLLSATCGDQPRKVFGRLEALNLERSGITDYQLERIIETNPRITELRLQKCLALSEEFFEYLARSPIAKSLKVLHVTKNDSVEMDERILTYIGKLTGLKSLSFHACRYLDPEQIKSLNEKEWRIPEVIPPHSADSPPVHTTNPTATANAQQQAQGSLDAGIGDAFIEVDPAYK
ncbi:MAG: hypothetical protein M1816_003434 [Peltula sp. TS41687]|nr:MAG: hypothetical protein M1816_003434 [Peltula sp. TS41687]